MGDLARIFAVGDGEATAAGYVGDVFPVRASDGVAVKAKLDVGVDHPGIRKGNVGRQVVVARLGGKAVVARPHCPLDVVVVLVTAIGVAADVVLVSRGNPQATVAV